MLGRDSETGCSFVNKYHTKDKSLTTVLEVLDPYDVDVRIDGAIGFKGSLAVVTSILNAL